jgi:hypothetical protein
VRGAFGFAVSGCGERWLGPATHPEAPPLAICQQLEPERAAAAGLERTGDRVRMPLPDGRTLELDTRSATACLHGPQPLSDDVLVHPYLGFAAALASRLLGRDVFHGGLVVVHGGAWLVCAGPTGGKSTLLAALADEGAPVLADDIAVIDDGRVHRGPRCLDLRSDAGSDGPGAALEPVRRGSRWRRSLPPAPATSALRGVLHLRFADTLALDPVPAADRLDTLARHRVIAQIPADPQRTLSLAALPTLELRRPRQLELLPHAIELLMARLPG